jgi:chromosome segregation ATPase
LLSKVQAKLLLAKGTRENKEKSKAAFFIQRQEREVQVRRLRDQKEAAQQRKHSLEQEMDRLESEFDSLQVHLIACVQREHRVTDSKSRHLEQLKALRERKEQQVSDFKALKAQKQEILAKELQVETLQSKILQLKQELKQRAAESVTSASDLDTQLTRLNSEDERWQRCYRAEQEKLKQQAEFLRVKEKRLSRTNSPRSG